MPIIAVPDTSVVVQTNELAFKTCLNFGPSYYRTFDGLEYEYGGMCTYTLLKDIDKGWKVELTPKNCAKVSECTKVWPGKNKKQKQIVNEGNRSSLVTSVK